MACKHYYKGHEFQNERQLDDFLLEKLPFEPSLGDLVFDKTQSQLSVIQQLKTISKETYKAKKIYDELKQSEKVTYNEDGEESIESPPYIGVNKYLSGLTKLDGTLLFPEFRENEYWNGRYSHWKLGEFTEDEIAEFELDKNNLPKITDKDTHVKLREQMENRWKEQAKSGSAVHDILRVCFSKTDKQLNILQSTDQLKQTIKRHMQSQFYQYVNDETISKAIEHARELYQNLVYQFGEDLEFYPEFAVMQNDNIVRKGEPTKLLGIIDLLIVDKTGKLHVLDYKTSTHSYAEFNSAKKLAYDYQLAVYQRMLQKYGLNTYEGKMLISPIRLVNFRKEGNKYTYDSLDFPSSYTMINEGHKGERVWENIDEFMPAPFELNITTEEATKTVSEIMAEWFPYYSSFQKVTRESTIKLLKKYKALEPDENGHYVWKREQGEPPIIATSESEFVDKVYKYELNKPAKRLRYTASVKSGIKTAMKNGIENASFPNAKITQTDGQVTWLKDIMSPYCNGSWEVQDNELLESFGIITLKTISAYKPPQYDFIRVSTSNLTDNYRDYVETDAAFKNRKGLIGRYEDDVTQKSKQGSLVVEAVNGNIEAMETMLLINQMRGLEGAVIGRISVVNPNYADGVQMSNEELVYNWNELNRHHAVPINRISNGTVKFASRWEIVRQVYSQLLTEGSDHGWKDGYQVIGNIRGCTTILDQSIDTTTEEKIAGLQKLLNELTKATTEKDGANILNRVYSTQAELNKQEVRLYNAILMAIGQLKGIEFRQQLKDHGKWFDDIHILKSGLSGTFIGNPGNMESDTLNLITRLVTEAYQNTRDDVLRHKAKITQLVNNLKKYKQFTAAKERTVGNQVDLYSNMFETTPEGDILFKNPNRLAPAEAEFLDFALYLINKNRHPDYTDEQLRALRDSNDVSYYRVPLAMGGSDSRLSIQDNLFNSLKKKLKLMWPIKAVKQWAKKSNERAKDKEEGLFRLENEIHDPEKLEKYKRDRLFEMSNMFTKGDQTEFRLAKIQEVQKRGESFERNVETLLYKHIFAYSVKNNIDSVFPMIKAAMIHILTQGSLQNTKFTGDIEYSEKYIRNKIFNESIVDPKLQDLNHAIGTIKSAASKLTLAFSPVTGLYQHISGLWNDISLIIRKPDGKQSFTFENFKRAFKIVYTDAFHYSDKPTIPSAVNEIYGINDMDMTMNMYTDRITKTRRGIWNADGLAMKFAIRPDYYNRMNIFVAQMLGDGSFDAHYLDKDGKLVYDWKKDKRFEAFANGRKSDPKYAEQKALYYAMAKQFVIEGAKNPDGTLFEMNMQDPKPLPRAYTNKEAEAMKSIGDNIYGYYSHEKRALVHSTLVGGLWLQFKTYWSSKKDIYLQPGGVKLQGRWEQLEIDGKKQYYQVDEKGNPREDLPFIETPTSAPVIQWKGQWQEGVMLTLHDMWVYWKNNYKQDGWIGAIKSAYHYKVDNVDPNLKTAYVNNLRQLVYDFILSVVGGVLICGFLADWLKELKEDNVDNDDLITGLGIAAANIAVMSVKNSFLDFNAAESIGGPIFRWNPFVFDWGARTIKKFMSVATGDEDIWDGIVSISGGLRAVEPALDAVKPDIWRNEREGGTFGVER